MLSRERFVVEGAAKLTQIKAAKKDMLIVSLTKNWPLNKLMGKEEFVQPTPEFGIEALLWFLLKLITFA